jgi:hypothetical protein
MQKCGEQMACEFIITMFVKIKYLEFVFLIDTELYSVFSTMKYSINTPQQATSLKAQN